MSQLKIILASSSSARKNILSSLKIPFEIMVSNVNEDQINSPDPQQMVIKRAEAKGKAVDEIVRARSSRPEHYFIIAADSTVSLNKTSYGKPKDQKEAHEFLKILSGKTHDFYTAVWTKNLLTQKTKTGCLRSQVTLKKLSLKEIKEYSLLDDLTKYAGAYSITNTPKNIIAKIEGSLTNVIGLPLEFLLPVLKENLLIINPILSNIS